MLFLAERNKWRNGVKFHLAPTSLLLCFYTWNRLEPSWNRRGTVAFAVFLHIPGAWNRLEPSWNRRGTVLFAVFSHTPGAFTLH